MAQTVLDPLAAESRFLVKELSKTGDPLDIVYSLVTEAISDLPVKARTPTPRPCPGDPY